MKTVTEQAFDELIDEQHPLFGDIVREMGGVPEMPEDLAEYDLPIGNNKTREVALDLFLAWLHLKQTGRAPRIPTEAPLPCAVDPDIYFQNWPAAEDFPEGEQSPAYQAEVRRVELRTAYAKKLCSTCPLAVQRACLLKALDDDREYVAPPGVVIGGWGDGAREKIGNRLLKFIRSYERGMREDAGIGRYGAAELGMSTDEREEFERKAMEIEVTS